jgi:hypothetical protein
MMYRLEVIEYAEGDEIGDSVVYTAAPPKLVWQKECTTEARAIRDAKQDILRRLRLRCETPPTHHLYMVSGGRRTEIILPQISYEPASRWEHFFYGLDQAPRFVS